MEERKILGVGAKESAVNYEAVLGIGSSKLFRAAVVYGERLAEPCVYMVPAEWLGVTVDSVA